MTFGIVTTGRQCADYMDRTLASIETQNRDDWRVHVVYDPSTDDGADKIIEWCNQDPDRRGYTINGQQRYALRNQVHAIHKLGLEPDDVIVWLDLDGDQLAHSFVLDRLAEFYADPELLVTFGQFQPIPDAKTCGRATPIPAKVVQERSYRKETLTVSCHWNHLRTMRAKAFNAIPEDQFVWPSGPKKGQWYMHGPDYVVMTAALELADGRHRFIDEVLLLYRHGNPMADNAAVEAAACSQNYLRRPPLAPLPRSAEVRAARTVHLVDQMDAAVTHNLRKKGSPMNDPYLPPEQRREILRQYGKEFGLRVFIETGTNDGGTPIALADDFETIYTIELSRSKYEAAANRFAGSHIKALFGDSTVILPDILHGLSEPALIWLDGHWSGGDTARGDKDTPILEELEAIFSVGIPHVVLIDDVRLFDGMTHHDEQPNWPHIDHVRKLAAEHSYECVISDDIARLTPILMGSNT